MEPLIKVNWQDIRSKILLVEPTFTSIVDKLNPDKKYPLYLAYYPYGSIDADNISTLFPDNNGNFFRLSDNNVPKDVLKNLGYSINNTPLGMVLEKELECFIDLKAERITIPWLIYTPGKFFPFSRILKKKSHRIYQPNGMLSSTAGARSTFMLPNIGATISHSSLQRDFNIKHPTPKTLYEHWYVFREIVNNPIVNSDWRACVLYFSESWVNKINNDPAWSAIKKYLYEIGWQQYEYEMNRVYYDITFSMIQKKRNLKPNPYLADTARHLFAIALGAFPGFSPSTNENSLPLRTLQKAFVNSYGLKKYFPTIMQPMHFNYEAKSLPVYYSFQNPSTHVFSPKSREESSTLFEIRELEHIMRIFSEELSKPKSLCSDTIIGELAKQIKFKYFHNKLDRHNVVESSRNLPIFDKRFCNEKISNSGAVFASDSPFARGCISIST